MTATDPRLEPGRSYDPPMSTIVAIEVQEFRDKRFVLVDRDVRLTLSCGCRCHLSMKLQAPLPRVGEPDWCKRQHAP